MEDFYCKVHLTFSIWRTSTDRDAMLRIEAWQEESGINIIVLGNQARPGATDNTGHQAFNYIPGPLSSWKTARIPSAEETSLRV